MRPPRPFGARTLAGSVSHALRGLAYCYATQRNFRVHVAMGVAAIGLGFLLDLGRLEMLALGSAIALVLVLETINTALEALIDAVVLERNVTAALAKDAAAATVLLAAAYSIWVGWHLFFERLPEIPGAAMSAIREHPILFFLWLGTVGWLGLGSLRSGSRI